MKVAIFVLLCAFSLNTLGAEQSFSKGRMSLTSGTKIEFDSLQLGEDEVSYVAGGSTTTIEKDKILDIEVSKGSETLTWTLGLGASAFLGATIGVNNAQNDTGVAISKEEKTSIVLTLTAVGAAIGALLGSQKHKFEKVYSNPKYSMKPKFEFLQSNKDGFSLIQASISF